MYELNGIIAENMISSSCLWLARERCLIKKTNKSIACDYWIDVGSTRESEWDKVKDRNYCGLSMFDRNNFDSG